jgi:tetratricopeptide (TPR) repeat protein
MEISELDLDFLAERISENPRSPLFARLADLYLAKGLTSEALALCEEGVKIYPSYTAGFVVLGRCYRTLARYSEAQETFKRAINLSPFSETAKTLLEESSAAASESNVEPNENSSESSEGMSVSPEASPEEMQSLSTPPTEDVHDQQYPDALPDMVTDVPAEGETNVTEEELSDGSEQNSIIPLVDEYVNEHLAAVLPTATMSLDEYLVQSSLHEPEGKQSDDLGTIAQQLQSAKPIVPRESDSSESSLDTISVEPDIVTPTLAEIYVSQGQYNAAIQAYEILMLSKPDEREKFEARVKELQEKLEGNRDQP